MSEACSPVGELLIGEASDKVRASFLPRMASGELLASILYTEPEAGSDLSALRTIAVRSGEGYRITGTKLWSLNTAYTDIALCAATTGNVKAGAMRFAFLVTLGLRGRGQSAEHRASSSMPFTVVVLFGGHLSAGGQGRRSCCHVVFRARGLDAPSGGHWYGGFVRIRNGRWFDDATVFTSWTIASGSPPLWKHSRLQAGTLTRLGANRSGIALKRHGLADWPSTAAATMTS